ncbi:MAG: S24 family peptidase [Pseudodesulfovibrio sp.]|jgi:phage repressor protein C with HTH and peptisase S24 domain|uniref:LexA family transcriptional regulator n=1 Tax=Pseudodesulfovibrio sp. TaxID=2035812 RepID=UPI003D0DFFDF
MAEELFGFEKIVERLKKATGTQTDSALAECLGITQGSLSGAKTKGKVPPKWLILASEDFSVSLDWLYYGHGSMSRGEPKKDTRVCADEAELVMVPMVQARLAAGSGSFETSGEVNGRYAFRNAFLSRRGNPSQMVLMRVSGDSMEPKIEDGDTVLIDQSRKEPTPGRVYAVGVEDMVYLKMLDTLPGKMLLKSYNPDYPPIEVDTRGDHADGVRIIGHVVWVGRELP